MDDKQMIRDGRQALTSLVTNLRSTRGRSFACLFVKYALSRYKEATGTSEQRLMIKMILYAMENSPEFSDRQKEIYADFVKETGIRK